MVGSGKAWPAPPSHDSECFNVSRAQNQNRLADARVQVQISCRGELLQVCLLIHFNGIF